MLLCALLVCGMAAAVAEAPEATGKLVLYSPLTTSMIENMLAMFEAAVSYTHLAIRTTPTRAGCRASPFRMTAFTNSRFGARVGRTRRCMAAATMETTTTPMELSLIHI